MADRPILFSGPMVRALLDGRKTQTRRTLNPQPYDFPHPSDGHRCWNASGVPGGRICISDRSLLDLHHRPAPGDRLYVREEWFSTPAYDDLSPSQMGGDEPLRYKADDATFNWGEADGSRVGRRRAGMHMPRWASRLTLAVADVRVERLQAISEGDAIAEGIEDVTAEVASRDTSLRFWRRYRDGGWNGYVDNPIASYASLWTEINGAGSWEANPWVVAVSFDVEHRNIDQ
jgi:hypothetical protein